MAERVIVLTNGETVQLDTTLTVYDMKQFKGDGIIPPQMLQNMADSLTDVDAISMMDDTADAVYIAYLNNKQDEHMNKEDFFKLLPNDILENAVIYGEVLGGPSMGKLFARAFRNATDRDSTQKKTEDLG